MLLVFRCIIDRGNSLDRESGLTDHLSGTARREKTDFLLDQTLGQVKQASLVIDGDDSYSIAKMEFRIGLALLGTDNIIVRGTKHTGLLSHDESRNHGRHWVC